MTLEQSGLAAPFQTVARWLHQRLPARLRGVVAMQPETDLSALPRRAKVRLVLPDQSLLTRELDLPELPFGRRRGWIEARLEEVSPWAAGAFLWAEAGVRDGQLSLVLAAAEPVRAAAARLQASGRRLVEVVSGPLWLMEDATGAAVLARRLMLGWLAAMALGLGLAGLSWFRASEAGAAEALANARLARLASEAQATSAAGQAAQRLLAGKATAASLAAALDRLAGSLPIDSYLETLRLTPTEFTISGRSAAPETIIPALEGQGGFTGVDFAGASPRDPRSGLYSFTLAGRTGGTR